MGDDEQKGLEMERKWKEGSKARGKREKRGMEISLGGGICVIGLRGDRRPWFPHICLASPHIIPFQ